MKYIVLDQNGNYQVISASGFIPSNVVCEAPADAQPDDGPYIIVVDGIAGFDEEARALKPKPVD